MGTPLLVILGQVWITVRGVPSVKHFFSFSTIMQLSKLLHIIIFSLTTWLIPFIHNSNIVEVLLSWEKRRSRRVDEEKMREVGSTQQVVGVMNSKTGEGRSVRTDGKGKMSSTIKWEGDGIDEERRTI